MRLLIPSLVIAASLTIIGCGDGGAGGGHGDGGHAMPPTQVGVAAPLARELPVIREVTGRIEAIEMVTLNPQVSGVVVKVHVADGAEVKAGDPILDIDEQPLKATLARISAEVARAESHLAQAKAQFERGKRLVNDQVISRQQYDDQEAAVRTAEAEVAAAKAAFTSAQLDLGYAKVTAPIAGRLGKILTTQGNLVQGGGPVPATMITSIVSIDPVYVSFDLDENTWRQAGARLRASTTGGEPVQIRVGLSGDQGFPHQGQVAFVDNRIDEGSGAIRIRARLANPDRSLTPGAFARVQVDVAPKRPVLLIHERAVQSQLDMRYVLTVDDKGVTGFRPVQLGDAYGQLRVVEGGLKADERIVVLGLAKIFYPGMTVAPAEASMETLEMANPPAGAGAPQPEAKPTAATTTEGAKP
jgi:RND family efflux transporter MFP subunit